jgi:hypothetical protein
MKLGWGFKGTEWYLLDASVFEFTKEGKNVGKNAAAPWVDWYARRK